MVELIAMIWFILVGLIRTFENETLLSWGNNSLRQFIARALLLRVHHWIVLISLVLWTLYGALLPDTSSHTSITNYFPWPITQHSIAFLVQALLYQVSHFVLRRYLQPHCGRIQTSHFTWTLCLVWVGEPPNLLVVTVKISRGLMRLEHSSMHRKPQNYYSRVHTWIDRNAFGRMQLTFHLAYRNPASRASHFQPRASYQKALFRVHPSGRTHGRKNQAHTAVWSP